MIHKELNLLVNSASILGATKVTSDGSTFEVLLNDSLQIPSQAKNTNISVHSATIWNNLANVKTNVNDFLTIGFNNGVSGDILYTIIIPEGNYSVNELDLAIFEYISTNHDDLPNDVITISGDSAQQKIQITFNYENVHIDFTGGSPTTGMHLLLGFPYTDTITSPNASTTIFGNSVARFNAIEYYLIHSNLVNNGILMNSEYSKTIAKVLITSSPGDQIAYQPSVPVRVFEDINYKNNKRLRFWLTDQLNQEVSTGGETWSAHIVISYDIQE
jgi:hypothetical protein